MNVWQFIDAHPWVALGMLFMCCMTAVLVAEEVSKAFWGRR